MEKTTAFEFFTAIVNGTLTEKEKTYAEAQIQKILADREKAAKKRHEKSAENEPIKHAILVRLSVKPMVASELAVALEVSTSKASAMCRQMVEDGLLSVSEVKSPTSKGKVKQYAVVQTATDADESAE